MTEAVTTTTLPAGTTTDPATTTPPVTTTTPDTTNLTVDKTEIPGPVTPVQNVDAKGKVTFEPTGDAGLDLTLKFFGDKGLTIDSPELAEAGKGNFAYLEAYLTGLKDKYPEAMQYLELAKQAYSRLETKAKSDYEARKKTVHDAVGGEDTWKNIVEFVKSNAETHELTEVTEALGKGGVIAKAMAQHLKGLYEAAAGTTKEPASAVRTAQLTAPGAGPLTLSGYKAELAALISKVGSTRLDDSPEYATLKRKYTGVTK